MKIVSFNEKGGCGKTTAVVNAAALCVERGVRCVVLDADRQKNTARFFARATGQEYYGQDLQCGSVVITNDEGAVNGGGLVLIDCKPVLTSLGEIPPVDLVLIPIDGQWAADGSVNVIEEVQRARPGTRIVVWANKFYDSKFGKAELNQIATELGVELYRFPIMASENFKRSEMMSQAVWKIPYASRSAAVQNFKMFCEWIVGGCSTSGTYTASDASRSEFSDYRRTSYARR